jgi:hypothetical protein
MTETTTHPLTTYHKLLTEELVNEVWKTVNPALEEATAYFHLGNGCVVVVACGQKVSGNLLTALAAL